MNKNEEAMITKLKRSTTEAESAFTEGYVWLSVDSRNETAKQRLMQL